ncbi:MAG: hypothetical protein KDC46_15030 [Thermoleophilia bacterium]|nr:hypothetical protein [Thermoleophilia bacterium]
MSIVDMPSGSDGDSSGTEQDPAHETWRGRRRRRRRFLDRYERRLAERRAGKHHPLKRPIRVTIGVLLILFGVAIGWLPGPGFVIFAFPGALLIASEWRKAALLMDRVEHETVPWIRRVRAKLRGGPRPEWVEEDPAFWGVWQERRDGSIADTGERRRRADAVADASDGDDGSAEAEAHSA